MVTCPTDGNSASPAPVGRHGCASISWRIAVGYSSSRPIGMILQPVGRIAGAAQAA